MTQPSLLDLPESRSKKRGSVRRSSVLTYQAERLRLCAAALRVLDRLKKGPAFNYELATPEVGGLRGVGRIPELRKQGYAIEKTHISGGTWRYELKESPASRDKMSGAF